MDYRETVARLFSLENRGVKLGLDNISRFCRRLGSPQTRFASIHVAGTNGKGSVTSLLDAILRQSGLKIGRFTSPHLRDFRERIIVNGRPITRQAVRAFVTRHWKTIRREGYSFFEVVTAMAFDSFARAQVDLAVVEVGLGGRFDATNILEPVLSIITHIDFDHERILGRTLRHIAFEKAGIIKKGVPVIIGPMPPAAHDVLSATARRRTAPFFSAGEILTAPRLPGRQRLRQMHWRSPLPGAHQVRNLGLALAAAFLVPGAEKRLTPDRICRGVRTVRWPARFQIVRGRPTVVWDVAHNPSGAVALARTFRATFGGRQAVALFTARADKDYSAMWRALAPCVSFWVGCPLPHHTTGIPLENMRRLAQETRIPFSWAETAGRGLRLARRLAGTGGLVLVAGSHYLVGALLPAGLVASPGDGFAPPPVLTWNEIVRSVSTRS